MQIKWDFPVPILPDFLQTFNNKSSSQLNAPSNVLNKNFDLHSIPNSMLNKHPVAGNSLKNFTRDHSIASSGSNVEAENGDVGILLAVKAFVQLFFNPIVGNLSGKLGYKNIIFIGTANLLLSSLSKKRENNSLKKLAFIVNHYFVSVFSMGESFFLLLIARGVEGVGSACINVCGMSLIAHVS